MSSSHYLRALLKRDLSAIRRVLFHDPLLEKKPASSSPPPGPPEPVNGDSGGEQQSAPYRVPGVGPDRARDDVERSQEEEDQRPGLSGHSEA